MYTRQNSQMCVKCVLSSNNIRTMPHIRSYANDLRKKQIAASRNDETMVSSANMGVFVGSASRNVLAQSKSPVKADENEI